MSQIGKLVLLVGFVLGGSNAPAQTASFDKVLIPVFLAEPLPGAFGSLWTTDVWISNDSDTAVDFGGGFDFGCSFPVCENVGRVDPGVTFRPRVYQRPDGLQGTFILVDSANAARLSFTLRFRDLSRQSQTWGTEVPVVRQNEFRSQRFSLVDIPVREGFRQTLRIYELDDTGRSAFVRVRAYRIATEHDLPSAPPDTFLGENVFPLQFLVPGQSSAYPGHLTISDLEMIAPLGGSERIRLEVQPETPGLHLWAFMTIVNNETQHATVITPQ